MSVTISISSEPDDIWMIRNTVYRWLVERVREYHPDESDVIERLTVCGYLGGVSLDTECSASPDLGSRIVGVLLDTADAIIEKRVPLTEGTGQPGPELEAKVHESLRDLVALLRRFQNKTSP